MKLQVYREGDGWVKHEERVTDYGWPTHEGKPYSGFLDCSFTFPFFRLHLRFLF